MMNEWQKPSGYSVAVIALVLALIGYLVHRGSLTVTESLVGALLGVITWVTKGARPPVADRIGSKAPPPPTALLVVLLLGGTMGCAARSNGAVDDYAKALDVCILEGKDAGSVDVYEACAHRVDRRFGR